MITPWRAFVFDGGTEETRACSLFLFLVAVFTLTALDHGLSALRRKGRTAPSRSAWQPGPPVLLILLSVTTLAAGARAGNRLLVLFPVLPLLSAAGYLRYWLAAPARKMHWWHEHMSGMGTACIATITAFLVTAVPRLFPEAAWARSPVAWIAPGVFLGTLLGFWKVRYEREFKERD